MKGIITALVLGMSISTVNAAYIDFESVPGVGTPTEGLAINNQFAASHGVTFSLEGGGSPLIAQTGAPTTAFVGFDRLPDQPAPGSNVGQFFLTDDGVVGPPPAALLIDYSNKVAAASGVILDIDDAHSDATLFERWSIQALDGSGGLLGSLVLISENVPDGSATPWSFSFRSASIERIRIEFTGGRNKPGFAFDNFSSSTSPLSLSEPPQLLLLGLGLAAVVLIRRRRVS